MSAPTYKFRYECPSDYERIESVWYGPTAKVLNNVKIISSVCAVEFQSILPFNVLLYVFHDICGQHHVAFQTLMPIENYTGERDSDRKTELPRGVTRLDLDASTGQVQFIQKSNDGNVVAGSYVSPFKRLLSKIKKEETVVTEQDIQSAQEAEAALLASLDTSELPIENKEDNTTKELTVERMQTRQSNKKRKRESIERAEREEREAELQAQRLKEQNKRRNEIMRKQREAKIKESEKYLSKK